MPYRDKVKQLLNNKRWRENNPGKFRKIAKESYLKNREKRVKHQRDKYHQKINAINEYKCSMGCGACGESDFRCLDFHHTNPDGKLFNISRGISHYSMAKIWAEIKKCVVLCSNCHRKLSHG